MHSTKRKKLSTEFIKKLSELSAGYLPQESFEQLISLFEYEASRGFFSHNVESNLLRIILAMFDKISFFNDCIRYPHYVELLISISASSNYLTDILVRNPEYLYWIVNPSNLREKLEPETLAETIKKMTSAYKTLGSRLNSLRTVKRKETLRIGAKDIFDKAPLYEVTGELSVLAKAITSELFSQCYNEVLNKYGINNIARNYAILALGKLGGNELNYSSDIDLMIFYDDDEQLTKSKNYQEILIEAIYLFIESATQITHAGYIYRVDFRLRPDGRNAFLTRTISYYLNYYESRGEDWEKQMLIKSSFVGGDKNLYDYFINYLTPFIYPSSFAISPKEQIKRLKVSIEKRIGSEENIKLSAGGIRDIEFSVQALQLIYGGKFKSLRTPNTLEAIERLRSEKLLSEKESVDFSTAYIFFRKIEHFLQLMNDKQTHTIPAEGEILERLSSYLGFNKTTEFKTELKHIRINVSGLYKSIMGEEQENKGKGREDQISKIKFENKIKAEKDLVYLREGKGILAQRQFDKDTIEAFNLIEDQLFEYLQKSLIPDIVVQNFARVIRSENFPSIWYKEFSNKKFFDSFLTLCEYSQKSIDLFAEDKDLRESLLTRKVFEKISIKNIGSYSTRRLTFMLLVQFTVKLITAPQVSKLLALYFKKRIEFITSREDLEKKINSDFFIAGLGSFGSGDLSFASDIDIIFAADKVSTSLDIQKYFQTLFLNFKEEFKPFELDCRLRPEGKSSWLVWDLKNYANYINTRARTWELQAFCKINFIYGNKKLFLSLLKAVKKRIEIIDKSKLKGEILEMRKKLYPQTFSTIAKNVNLKKSRGGITDIEFTSQFLILYNPELYLSCAGKSTIDTISKIITVTPTVADDDLEILKDNFLFLKNIELMNQNVFNTLTSVLPSDEKKIKMLSEYLGYNTAGEFQANILSVMKSNQLLFEKYIGR